jgi:hypothetical protein
MSREITDENREWRREFKQIISNVLDSDDKAEAVLQRIADRLGGYTHDQAVARNPMPEDTDE